MLWHVPLLVGGNSAGGGAGGGGDGEEGGWSPTPSLSGSRGANAVASISRGAIMDSRLVEIGGGVKGFDR